MDELDTNNDLTQFVFFKIAITACDLIKKPIAINDML